MKTEHNISSINHIFLIITLVMWCVATDFSHAAIIHVPGDYPTIQEGINSATHGDILLVADGTYTGAGNKNIDFQGKLITVKSENGPESTIIDCEGSGRGFYFWNGELNGSILEGFTIKNGNTDKGAGIYCINNSAPTIKNNIITGNRATGAGDGISGGGIYCQGDNIVIEKNIITGNTASASAGGDKNSSSRGGGIRCKGNNIIIENNIITDNTASASAGKYGLALVGGGGIHCEGDNYVIKNNLITGNIAIASSNDGPADSVGGGIYCNETSLIINNVIANNQVEGKGLRGGGVCVVDDCTFVNNTIVNNRGSGIYCERDTITITNTILWINVPSQITYSGLTNVTYSCIQGGYTGEGNINQNPLFVNSAIGDYHLFKESPCIDAGTLAGAPATDIDGNLRDDKPDMGAYEYVSFGDVSEDGNVTAYDAALVLQYVVGMINLSEAQLKAADVTGNGTVSALDAALILQYTVGLITQFPAEITTTAPIITAKSEEGVLIKAITQLESTNLNTEQEQVLEQLKNFVFEKSPKYTTLLHNFPNPFNPETWIPYQLAQPGDVTIRIYDVNGKLVRNLEVGHKNAGIYMSKERAAYWNGRNDNSERVSSGIYFYQLRAGEFRATRKMAVSK
jgi:hypothetical protein